MAHRYLSDVISRQDHELALQECATSNALKIGEAAVAAEQEKQAHAQEMAITISAHSAETERVRKVRSAILSTNHVNFMQYILICMRSYIHQR